MVVLAQCHANMLNKYIILYYTIRYSVCVCVCL